jgi:hypothetical protein
MKTAEVIDGSCGFRTHVAANRKDKVWVELTITSECDAVTKWSHSIKEVNLKKCLGQNPLTSRLWQSAMEMLRHRSCPVLTGVLRVIEVEVGAALPADIQIHFLASRKSEHN